MLYYSQRRKKEGSEITDLLEKNDRFETFVLLIDEVHKCISRIKQGFSLDSSVKSVHTLWIYEIFKSPNGLTATELAGKTNIDRSLISREMNALKRSGYVKIEDTKNKRSYNARILLTDEGMKVAEKISEYALKIQESVSRNIDREDLLAFYTILDKICNNLSVIADETKGN